MYFRGAVKKKKKGTSRFDYAPQGGEKWTNLEEGQSTDPRPVKRKLKGQKGKGYQEGTTRPNFATEKEKKGFALARAVEG